MPASRHQDHPTSPSAYDSVVRLFDTISVHRILRPTSVTMAKRPSCRAQDTRTILPVIWQDKINRCELRQIGTTGKCSQIWAVVKLAELPARLAIARTSWRGLDPRHPSQTVLDASVMDCRRRASAMTTTKLTPRPSCRRNFHSSAVTGCTESREYSAPAPWPRVSCRP